MNDTWSTLRIYEHLQLKVFFLIFHSMIKSAIGKESHVMTFYKLFSHLEHQVAMIREIQGF